MMKNRYIYIIAVVIIASGVIYFLFSNGDKKTEIINEATVRKGTVKSIISSTGTVLPQNRLEVKPPLNGRIDKILVKEGQYVKSGRVIAWMSSSERAALIDSARAKGDKSVKYWDDAYKPIPIVSPINGTIIVRAVEPGQSVTTSNPVMVVSDRLIVKADVDETDIGKVKKGRKTIITLDAYPEINVFAKVNHISYESKVINNVTMYEVDILPDKVPEVFRSGMSANVDIIEAMKEDALLVPLRAVYNDDDKKYVLVKDEKLSDEYKKLYIKTGLTDEDNIEVINSLKEGDTVVIKTRILKGYGQEEKGRNPFRPQFKKKK